VRRDDLMTVDAARDPGRKVLVVDIGGSNVKILATGHVERRKIPSGPEMTPERMVRSVIELASDWEYDVISIGYPGPVRDGHPTGPPQNVGEGWVGFDYEAAFGVPVRLMNDAAMQALGSYPGQGRMLFLGLGTGLGSAIVDDWEVEPMELAHLPYKKGKTFEDYVGLRGLEERGERKWRKSVLDVIRRLAEGLQVDYVVVGGGNARRLKRLPEGVLLGENANAFVGGFRMWEEH
jgi:predicted NBD/HSP70 family sugar kinase